MAKLVFGMNQSLDGYVDHMAFAPSAVLFQHFIGEAQAQSGSVYGRRMYEVMRYWDDEHPEWNAAERAFASAWRQQPKMGCLAVLEVRWPERHAGREQSRLGHGKPYFAGPRSPLHLKTNDRIGEDVIRLTYVPAGDPKAIATEV